jgi:sugar phosphate isomerase/epimerase
MKNLTRSLAVGLVAFGLQAVPVLAGSFNGPIGLQLYSLRADFPKDVSGTLKLVEKLGFKEVELAGTYGLKPEEFKKQLDAHGFVPIAAHFPFDKFRDDPESIAREAQALGLKYAGVAWIPHKGAFDEKQARAAAAVFNSAGKVFAKYGIKAFYHCHGYEFAPLGDGTVFDVLMKATDPQYVTFEMDILWVVFPGQDPVKLLEKYPTRWELIHLKDLKKGVKTGELTGHTDVKNDVSIGSGQMDYPSILKTAQKLGIKHYFIEDESPSVHEQLPKSIEFLKNVTW